MGLSGRNLDEDLNVLAKAFFNNLQITNMEYGGIGLDSKRPFGNSNASYDILELLDVKMEGDDGEVSCYASWQIEYADDLYHNELIPYLKRTCLTAL